MRLAVIHGPNLNLLGQREPHIYGTETLSDLEARIEAWSTKLGVDVAFSQTNSEGSVVTAIQNAESDYDAIILNPGGFTHTSAAIADAVSSISIPTVEVHLSDIHKREQWRSISLVAPSTVRQISGRGPIGYRDAIRHLINRASSPYESMAYGPDTEHVADFRPAAAGHRLVVLVHGGLWLGQWERDTMESLAVGLNQVGYGTMNIEYRRLGRRPVWPASGHDVELAVRYATTISPKVSVVGHSAGGYLGLWVHRRNPGHQMVGLASLTDLGSSQADHLSVAEVINAGAPPVLGPPEGSVVLLHGSEDSIVDPGQSARFEKDCTVRILPGMGHFDLLDPSKPHWEVLLEALDR